MLPQQVARIFCRMYFHSSRFCLLLCVITAVFPAYTGEALLATKRRIETIHSQREEHKRNQNRNEKPKRREWGQFVLKV